MAPLAACGGGASSECGWVAGCLLPSLSLTLPSVLTGIPALTVQTQAWAQSQTYTTGGLGGPEQLPAPLWVSVFPSVTGAPWQAMPL